DAEADEITGAARYERSGERKAYRAGHYRRDGGQAPLDLYTRKGMRLV
ncbi:IS256 family transposase, partial [Blautia wexlerae]|nr:IS256 family transposase [Blautia wexlerae]